MRLLLGVADFGEHEEKMLCRAAKKRGIDVVSCERRYTKAGIMQYLDENPDTDVVVLSEAVEGKAPYMASDYELLAERHENVRVVPILMDERCGTEYVQDVFYSGIYNALFASDADMNMVLRLMDTGRSRKEAKIYYKLRNVDETGNVANIDRCVRHICEAASVQELTERVVHIHNMLNMEEFDEVLTKLDEKQMDAMRAIPEIATFIPDSKNKTEEAEPTAKGGILSSLASAITGTSPVTRDSESAASEDIRQPDPVSSGLRMNALSVDDLFEIISNVIVGFVGNQRRSGVTHQAITASHFLAAHGYRVALADCSVRSGKSMSAFEAIERYRDTTILTSDSFSYLGVDYYKNMSIESLNKIFSSSEKYHFVIIDYGTFSPYVKADIGRCSIKCAVCGSMPWEINQLRAFADDTKFLAGQITYLIRGVAQGARDNQMWVTDLVGNYRFADIQEDPFDGTCYPALAGLFDKYVKGLPAVQNENGGQSNKLVNVKRAVETPIVPEKIAGRRSTAVRLFHRREKKIPVAGTLVQSTDMDASATSASKMGNNLGGCWFVTALKHGVGCSYTSAVVANLLAEKNTSVCLITDDEDLGEYVSGNVKIYLWSDPRIDLFASYSAVVMDGGVLDGMLSDRQHEMAQTSHKYMVCRSGDDYMRSLAGHVSDDEEGSFKWAYIFNQIPPSDHGKVKRLMSDYDICFMPSCDAKHLTKDLKRSFSGIL